jgi:hypothetical protein
VECYAGEKDRVNQSAARNEKEKISLGMFSLNECTLVYRLHRTIAMREGRSGKESRLLSTDAAQHLRAVDRHSAYSNDWSAEAVREPVAGEAIGFRPDAPASRGESAYRITPCSLIANVGR